MTKVKVIIKHPGLEAIIQDIDNDCEAFQKIVGGDIERINVPEMDVVFIVNSEGKLHKMPTNIVFGKGIIVGPIVVVSEKKGYVASLSKEQINNVSLAMDLASV